MYTYLNFLYISNRKFFEDYYEKNQLFPFFNIIHKFLYIKIFKILKILLLFSNFLDRRCPIYAININRIDKHNHLDLVTISTKSKNVLFMICNLDLHFLVI